MSGNSFLRLMPSRRDWLRQASNGFGMLALSSLLAKSVCGGTHHPPKAKSVILCYMDGGPSHVDTFDPKPLLRKHQGENIGASAVSSKSQSSPDRVWFGSPWEFQQHGQSGLWVSDLFPHIASVADELCVIRSMVGQQPLHGQQNLLLHTGRVTGGAPSFGSWVSYALGSPSDSLPNYVLLNNEVIPNGGLENYGSAFLPTSHAATMLRANGVPMDNIAPTDTPALQRRKLELLREQDMAFARSTADDGIESAIKNYEMASRMQTTIPELTDVGREKKVVRQLYGAEDSNDFKRSYSVQCLRARRLVEAGLRFIEVTCPLDHENNSPWDQHGNLKKHHASNAMYTDQGVAALIQDLKQTGLLDTTIVIWAGEMGRTPHTMKITDTAGRDHHVNGYSIFVAGGGFKKGFAYGSTDEFGNSVAENPMTVHDLHATVLHQLGLDHRRLTFRFGGRDVSLTDVHGEVVRDLLT
jgi:hypothetical protein